MRPIDADALARRLKHSPLFLGTNLRFKDGVIDLVERQPTLDVVPREEVDRLRHILNSYALQYGAVKDKQKVIDRIKQETAREIFEEIDSTIDLICAMTGLDVRLYGKYAELEKKYTEDGK